MVSRMPKDYSKLFDYLLTYQCTLQNTNVTVQIIFLFLFFHWRIKIHRLQRTCLQQTTDTQSIPPHYLVQFSSIVKKNLKNCDSWISCSSRDRISARQCLWPKPRNVWRARSWTRTRRSTTWPQKSIQPSRPTTTRTREDQPNSWRLWYKFDLNFLTIGILLNLKWVRYIISWTNTSVLLWPRQNCGWTQKSSLTLPWLTSCWLIRFS